MRNEITISEALKIQIYNIHHSAMFWVLVFAVFLDLITGIGKAIVEKKFNSTFGRNGFVRHVTILITIIIVGVVLGILELNDILYGLLPFYIFVQVGSILENLTAIGCPVPQRVVDLLEKVKEKADK